MKNWSDVCGSGFRAFLDYKDRGRAAESEITQGGFCMVEIVREIDEGQ